MVRSVVPTLIQEIGEGARSIEEKRADLAAVSAEVVLTERRAAGDPLDRRQHRLHGAEGRRRPITRATALADRWALDAELEQVAARWSIDPQAELREQPVG